MPKYSMPTDELQEFERLADEKFDWRSRKEETLELADIYRETDIWSYADRAKVCATWLEYRADDIQRELRRYNACQIRLCPLCNARRAKMMATRLRLVLEEVYHVHPGSKLIFLTLTLPNVSGDELRKVLDELTRAWSKLMRRRQVVRVIKGWFRAIEVTRNRSRNDYHPHIHAILVVESEEYFKKSNPDYISQPTWRRYWSESLQADYDRVGVDIRKARGKKGNDALSAATEAAKYAVKGSEYISPRLPLWEAADVVQTYTLALQKKRMTAMGGWVREAARTLKLELEEENSDLVHNPDGNGELTDATAPYIEDYNWHGRIRDYLLHERRANPDYQGEQPKQPVKGGDAEGGDLAEGQILPDP